MAKEKKSIEVSRRQFLQGLGVGAGVLSVGGTLDFANAALYPKASKSEKHNVVVIGTGLSGFCAALQAKMDGADCVIIDKMPENQYGGNSKLSAGLIAIPADNTPKAKDEYYEDFMKKNMGKGSPEITRLLADQSLEGVDWLKSLGVEYPAPIGVPGYRVKAVVAPPGIFRGMPKMLETLKGNFIKKGGKIFYDTKAKQLILDDRGKVVGVRALTPKGLRDYMADAVVIATGGYAANKQYLESFVDPDADDMMVRGVTWATGDGHAMAQEAGAGLVGMGGLAALHIAAVSPKNTSAGNPFMAVALCLGINRDGKRYVDESKGYVANGKATMKQPGQTVALVFDEEIKKQAGIGTTIKQFQGLGLEVVEADTLEALAGKINVPPAQLVKTITEFNNAVKDGKAPGAIPPKEGLAYKVEKPKFYAIYPLVPGITLTFGSIKTNGKAQVLEADGRVIAGIYAAGECAGGLFYDDYVGGGSLANCLVTGRIAGRQAAAERKAAAKKK
jgi:flavocytochrome c